MDRNSLQKTYYGFILVKKNNGKICGRFPLMKKECSIGREKSCDLRILLDCVSSQHCIISYIDDKAYVRDKSLAGTTKVNGKKIGRSNFLLHQSDEIEICGRKFVWEYAWADYHPDYNCLSGKKSGTNLNCTTPRVSTKVSSQVNTPLVPQDNNKLLQTPAKSSMKTLISINKTPIVLASTNMSKLSFEELKESFKDQNINVHSQSKPRVTKSYSTVSGHNIPLISDSKTTPRKSWVITSTEDSSSGASNLNRLSSERSKIDFTPEYDTSYHYEYENVEFDTTESPFILSNDKYSANMNTTGIEANNSSLYSPSDSIETHSQSSNMPNFESEPSSSRRDTYSIDDRLVVIEQNTTPAPRRSILKCSKTARPNRSRSSCRMVQFARLPNSESRIKMSRSRFNTGSNFVITDDEVNDIDVSQDSRKVEVEVVEFDDDLDGVQPLDSSVSSLINSPILENPVLNKSSKRGSRGNKVMSLISSFERRTTESPKHSIRASDLLTISGLKHGDTSLSSQNNTNTLEESVSSTRRVNLENIFEAEDSLKNLENETIVSKIDENSVHNIDLSGLSVKQSLLSNIDTEKLSDDIQNKDLSECALECGYNFASPLNLHPQTISNNVTDVQKISDDTQNKDVSGNIEREYNFASPLNLCPGTNAVSVNEKDEVENSPIHEFNKLSNINNINTHRDEEDNDKTQTIVEKPSDVLKLSNGSIVEKKNVSKLIEETSDEESPSMIVQCMSEMFNNTIDELETTNSHHKLDITKTYVIVEKDCLKNSKKSNEFNKNSNQKMNTNSKINDENFNRSKEIVERKNASDVLAGNNTIIIDSIEAKLCKVYGYQNTYCNNETVFADKISSVNNKNVMFDSNSQGTVIDYVKNNDSTFIKSSTKKSMVTNGKNISDTVDELFVFSETENMKEKSVIENNFQNCQNNLTNSKHNTTEGKNSDQLNTSNLSVQSMDQGETHNSNKIIEVINISSESDTDEEIESSKNMNKTNLDQSLSTSFGKPQYESTPWNSSRNSKVLCNSTSSVKVNKTTRTSVSENKQSENSHRTIPFPEDPEVWSQMMKDFNESVKKASFTRTTPIDVSTVNKVLFDQESKISTEKDLSSNYTNITNNNSKVEKKNTLQCSTISSCLPDNNTSKTVTNNSARKSIKSNNEPILKRSSSVKAVDSPHVENNDNSSKSSIHDKWLDKTNSINTKTTNKIDMQSGTMKKQLNTDLDIYPDSSLPTSQFEFKETKIITRKMKKNPSPSLPFTRRKLRARANKNELGKSIINKNQLNNKRVVSDEILKNNCDTYNISSSESENISSTPIKKSRLRNLKPTMEETTAIKQKDNEIVENNSVKIKSVTLQIKTRSTRNNTSLSEFNNVLKLNKKNKTLSPIKTKLSAKVEKIIETKKSIHARSKRVKQSKISASDSLEDESLNETKKISQKPQESGLLKVNKYKKKDDIQIDNSLSILPTQHKLKEKIDQTSLTSSPQIRATRGCKRAADTPISAPKAKGLKHDILSKVNKLNKKNDIQIDNTSSIPTQHNLKEKIDQISLTCSPQIRATRSRKRAADTPISAPKAKGSKHDILSKVASKTASHVSNSPQNVKRTRNMIKSTDSLIPESTVDSKIEKSTRTTRAKKHDISTENAFNGSSPFVRKKPKSTNSSSIKTRKVNSEELTSSASKTLHKNIVKKSILSKPMRTRNTKQPVPVVEQSPAPTPRVLRLRQKKQ